MSWEEEEEEEEEIIRCHVEGFPDPKAGTNAILALWQADAKRLTHLVTTRGKRAAGQKPVSVQLKARGGINSPRRRLAAGPRGP